jgi:protein translocase SecG subunit
MNPMIWLNIAFIVITIALIASIMLQSSSAGLGSAFGGGAEGFYVRRGSEKRLFQATVVLSVLFFITALAHLFIA